MDAQDNKRLARTRRRGRILVSARGSIVQHLDDLVVNGRRETRGRVTGTTLVRPGGTLIAHGQLAGDLIIEPGGSAIIRGQASRTIRNEGHLEVYGQVVGRNVGNPPINQLGPDQLVGNDLPVPFKGGTIS